MLTIRYHNAYDIKAQNCSLRYLDYLIIITANTAKCDARLEIRMCGTKYIWYRCRDRREWIIVDHYLFRKLIRSFTYGNPMTIDRILCKYSHHVHR